MQFRSLWMIQLGRLSTRYLLRCMVMPWGQPASQKTQSIDSCIWLMFLTRMDMRSCMQSGMIWRRLGCATLSTSSSAAGQACCLWNELHWVLYSFLFGRCYCPINRVIRWLLCWLRCAACKEACNHVIFTWRILTFHNNAPFSARDYDH